MGTNDPLRPFGVICKINPTKISCPSVVSFKDHFCMSISSGAYRVDQKWWKEIGWPQPLPLENGKEFDLGLYMFRLIVQVLCYKDFKRSWQSSRIGRRKKACSLWWAICLVHNNPSCKWDIRLLGIKKPKIHPRARTEDMWSHRGEKINKLPLPVFEHCYPTRQHC